MVHKTLAVADYLLTSTYPLVNDPKLLLGVLKHLDTYYRELLPLLLQKQHITPLTTTKGQLEQLQHHSQSLLTKQHIQHIKQVFALAAEHQASTVEFTRNDPFVMADNQYRLHLLTAEKLKGLLQEAKAIDTLTQ